MTSEIIDSGHESPEPESVLHVLEEAEGGLSQAFVVVIRWYFPSIMLST